MIRDAGFCFTQLISQCVSTISEEYDDNDSTKLWDAKKIKYKEIESKYRWKLNELGVCTCIIIEGC